jgi:long-subunit fatty acid transport protein
MNDLRSAVRPARNGLRTSILASALAAALAVPATARAGGLVLPGIGPVSTGRAGASVASIADPSALATNPAGLAGLHGTTVNLGFAFIDYHLTVDRDGTYDDVADRTDPWEGQPYAPVSDTSTPAIGVGSYQLVPVIAVATDLGRAVKGLTIAAGVYAPNAYPTRSMGADYTIEDPTRPPTPTRYDIVKQNAAVALPSIAAAYRVNRKLDVGARISAGIASLEATTFVWGLDNYDEWSGKDAQFHVEATDNFVPAFGLGARFRPSASLELGFAWSSAIPVRAKGTGSSQPGSGNTVLGMPVTVIPVTDDRVACATGGTPDALKACVDFDLPMQVTLGGRWILRDELDRETADVELDVAWEQWSAASDYNIRIDGIAAVALGPPPVGLDLQPSVIRHNFQDTFAVRLGGSWQHDLGPGRLTVRGGAGYDTAAAKTNWERADLDGAARTTVTVGGSYQLKKVRFDLGGGAVIEPERSQGSTCNPPVDNAGCAGGPATTGPDPIQPTKDATAQAQSPFAGGSYQSGYTMFMLGVSTWF